VISGEHAMQIARGATRKLRRRWVDTDDLVSEAVVGILEADAKGVDPGLFTTIAWRRGIDYLRRAHPQPRRMFRFSEVDELTFAYAGDVNDDPVEQRIASLDPSPEAVFLSHEEREATASVALSDRRDKARERQARCRARRRQKEAA
jgi:DNA-directed RNA polymerase specialized sigma24 family protein